MVSQENMQLQTFTPCRKFRLDDPTCWAHHRGGWTYAISLIRDNLCCEDGVLFISSVEDTVLEEQILEQPWVGVIHQVVKNNYEWFPDLERLVVSEIFLASLKSCKGLFTLSSTVKDYLRNKIPHIPIVRLWYPATPTDVLFQSDVFMQSPTRNVIFIGEFMRNFQYFYDIDLPNNMQKILLKSPDVDYKKLGVQPNTSVRILEYVPEDDYDKLLSTSVVFLNLHDAPANTTVIECITRGTPIVVNRLPGLEEYLGREYPLFYETVDEAKAMLTSDETLMKGMKYLKSLKLKAKLDPAHFIYSIQNSSIYRALPTPVSQVASQPKRFKSYDITVVICSYRRVYNMSRLLQCFVDQTTDKSFEVIVWNNNFEAKDELQSICNDYADRLDLKVIHSTENYYCIIRLAAANLMRSDVMMICDDDVIPTPEFLKVYWEKHQQYGPEAVLCCRGHKFWDHDVNEENPAECWMEYENLRFFDEKHEDVKIHFLHADTCLFPKNVLLKAIQHPLPSYDVILVDDYWLSFVFSHHLRVPIWKIKGDNLFASTPCAEDTSIALYLNSRVREERINFYLYHMRQGWPHNVIVEEEEADE